MTAAQLLKMSDDEFAALDPSIVTEAHREEIARLARLKNRLSSIRHDAAEESRPKSLREIGDRLGVSTERARQLEKIALMKIRSKYPELSDLLNS